jgi:argininosuccinate synthase
VARESPTSLYNQELGSMDVEGGFDQTDARGFIKLNAIRLKAHNVILDKKKIGLYHVIQPGEEA